LVDAPRAVRLLGDARLPIVEEAQSLVDRFAHGASRCGGDGGAVLPGGVEGGGEIGGHRELDVRGKGRGD
jgi:hypothetical protein